MANITRFGGGMASGGSAKGLYYVELPRSRYYEDVAEWVTTDTVDQTVYPSLQVICNGELWNITQSGIYARNLTSKKITYSESMTLYLLGSNNMLCGIATDGESRIWWTGYSTNIAGGVSGYSSSGAVKLYIYEYNVLTHTVLYWQVGIVNPGTNYASNTYYHYPGVLLYSSVYNRIYILSAGIQVMTYYTFNTNATLYNGYLNLDNYTMTTLSTGNMLGVNYWLGNCYTYEDENGYIFFGDGVIRASANAQNTYILRFNPYDNTITVVRTDFNDQMSSATCDKAYFTIGDTIYIMNKTNVMAIDPKTGEFRTGEMPAVLGLDLIPSMKAIYNNTVYIWTNVSGQSLVECTFYHESPPKAPIVAKIYKGQKFHTLAPFKLLRQGIEVTTEQQTATEDIEIKMYDYSSEGGQLLYIETT